jgi:hypothetical protein
VITALISHGIVGARDKVVKTVRYTVELPDETWLSELVEQFRDMRIRPDDCLYVTVVLDGGVSASSRPQVWVWSYGI